MIRWWLALALIVFMALPAEAITPLGVYQKGATVRCPWNTTGADGASITRATNGTVSVYIDGGTTEITTGVTDTEDFDATTGMHLAAIATTDAAYTSGSDFLVAVKAATIDGKVVNAWLCHFAIERAGDRTAADAREAVKQTTTSYIAYVYLQDQRTGGPLTGVAHTDLTAHVGRTDQGNAGGTAITLVAGTRGTWIPGGWVAKDPTFMPGWYEFSLTDAMLTAGAPKSIVTFRGAATGTGAVLRPTNLAVDLTGASSADTLAAITGVQADTDDLQTRLPAALVSGRMDSSVGSMVTDSLSAAALSAAAADKIGDDIHARALRDSAQLVRNVAGQRGFQVWISDATGQPYLGAPATVTVEVKKDAADFGAVSGSFTLTGGGAGGDGHFLATAGASDLDCAACVYRFLVSGVVRARVNVTTTP